MFARHLQDENVLVPVLRRTTLVALPSHALVTVGISVANLFVVSRTSPNVVCFFLLHTAQPCVFAAR